MKNYECKEVRTGTDDDGVEDVVESKSITFEETDDDAALENAETLGDCNYFEYDDVDVYDDKYIHYETSYEIDEF